MKQYILLTEGLIIALLLALPTTSYAAVCSDRVKNSYSKALANREKANVNLQIARANEQFEITYQYNLGASLESRYKEISMSSFAASVRPTIQSEIDKQLEKARRDISRSTERALKSRRTAVESAQRKYDRALNRVPVLDCTL